MHRNWKIILAVAALMGIVAMLRPAWLMNTAPFILIGLIPAGVACWKGHADRFGTWWLYGSVLGLLALIHVTFLPWRRSG